MALLTDMGGFPCAGLQVQYNPRVGMPYGPYSRRDGFTASGGETILLLSSPPRSLFIFKNGSLMTSGYTVTAVTAITLSTALTSGDTIVVAYDSLYPISATTLVPSPADSLFPNVQSLLHLEGADGSTTFTDVLGNTWTAGNGAVISNAWSAFGATSGYFGATTAYISTPDSSALRAGTGDFCLEWQMNFTSLSNYQTVISKGYTSSGDWAIQTDTGNGRLIVYFSGSAIATESSGTINTGQKYFCRVRRSGSTVTIERDGTVVASGTSSANLNSTAALCIGSRSGAGIGHDYTLAAYIDEFRLTIGNARSANAIQSAAWPDHA